MNTQKSSLLPKFSVSRPVTVIMILLALLVVGFIAFQKISVELFPKGFVPPFLGVWVPYPNSNPQEVEEQIAKPVEEQVQTISGVRRVNSHSHTNGCWTFLEFTQDMDMDLAYSQLHDRMDRVKPELPEDIERFYIRKWSDDDDPVLWIALVQKSEVNDPYLLVEQHIQKPLERIDGVAKVDIWGADEKSVLIYVNQDLVKTYKVNLYEVVSALQRDNFAISSGFVREGNKKIYVRSVGKFATLEDIRNVPIRGPNLRLKDIATVTYDVPERHWRNQIDGKKAISLGIFKESNANTVQLCRDVERAFAEEIEANPKLALFERSTLFNQGELIQESIENLQRSAFWGGLFAFIILFYFLRRMRMTLILTIAIPLSILISLTVLYFINWTLNVITMMGLMISIGMVVDNSIVVLENIYRKRSAGLDNFKAALVGASEVSLAVTLATLTTVVVFLPLILMNDEIGFKFYMMRIGLPVIFSLLASLFVAMIFIPLTATRFVSHHEIKKHPKLVEKISTVYGRILKRVLHHRVETFIFLTLVIMSMFFAASKTASKPGMDGNVNDFRLFFDLPKNYTIEDTERILNVVEDSINIKRTEYGVRTVLSRYSQNWGRIRVFLEPPPRIEWYDVAYQSIRQLIGVKSNGVLSREEVIEDLNKRLPEFPGVKIRQNWHDSGGGNDASLSIMLYGDDTNTLSQLAMEVERRLNSIEDIISVETELEEGNDEIRLRINREQAKKYGISPAEISGSIQYALRGLPMPKFHTAEKEVDVHVQLREEDRRNLPQLKNLTFFTDSGTEIPLDALVKFEVEKGFGEISRENGKTYLQVKANTTKDNMENLYQQVDGVMQDMKMPYGYTWTKGEHHRRMQESSDSQMFALILSGTFVFLIMGVLFESFVLPLSVLLAIPFAFVGAYWMMFLTKTPIDTMSQIGFVILIGVVVNNAIVLIDLINRLRNEGMGRREAILKAGNQRFRPIMMTAFTTIGGLMPMAVGNAKMIGIPYAPMGRTIIGGLLTSTMFTLVAVPWAYTLFDDMRIYFKKMMTLYLARTNSTALSSDSEK